MMPPPRVTSLHTHASLRASALRSSLVPALPMPSIFSTSSPSSTSTVFPSRRRRLASPWASVDLPDPLMPVNQTVNPLDELPRVMMLLAKKTGHDTRPPLLWQGICWGPFTNQENDTISNTSASLKSRSPAFHV